MFFKKHELLGLIAELVSGTAVITLIYALTYLLVAFL